MAHTMKNGLVLALAALALAGCSSTRLAELHARLGLGPSPVQTKTPGLAPEMEAKLASLYRQGAEAMQRNDLEDRKSVV